MTDEPLDDEQLAARLNFLASATVEALLADDPPRQQAVAVALRASEPEFASAPDALPFLRLLRRWLAGTRPTEPDQQRLAAPFQQALAAMLEEVPPRADRFEKPVSSEPEEVPARADRFEKPVSSELADPISRPVLVQLIAATVAASMSDKEEARRALASHLVTVQGRLQGEGGARLVPLLENLRAVLGGTDPYRLPRVPDAELQRLWDSARDLLGSASLDPTEAHEQLLERLVHNTRFVRDAARPDLTQALSRSLFDVQRQALASDAPAIATLVAAIRALLQGLDATPLAALLDGDERAAWERIVGGSSG